MQTESRLCTLKAASPSAPIWAPSPGNGAAGLTSRPGPAGSTPPTCLPARSGAACGGAPACPLLASQAGGCACLGWLCPPHVEACAVQLTPSTCSQRLGSCPPLPHPRPPRCQWLRLSPVSDARNAWCPAFLQAGSHPQPSSAPQANPLHHSLGTEEAPPFKGPYLMVLRLWELSVNQQAFN